MGVPTSGPLGLRGQVAKEFYGNETGSDISIHAMAVAKGFATPDAFSEWYGYTSNVTVTLDGGQSRTGPPGTGGFGSMTINVSAPAGRGYTSTDRTNATLTGLPAAFVASFATTGTSTGRWSITTPDGLFPNDSYDLLSSNFSINNPSTPLYTLNVTFNGSSGLNGNRSSTVFQGSTAGVGVSRGTSAGYLYDYNGSGNGPGVTVNAGGCNTTGQYVSAYRVMNGNFSTNVYYISYAQCKQSLTPCGYVNAPPWSQGSSQGIQTFLTQWYPTNSQVDSRVQGCYCLQASSGCNQSGTIWIPVTPNGQDANRSYQAWAGPGTGTYTVTLCNSQNGIMDQVAGYPFC